MLLLSLCVMLLLHCNFPAIYITHGATELALQQSHSDCDGCLQFIMTENITDASLQVGWAEAYTQLKWMRDLRRLLSF